MKIKSKIKSTIKIVEPVAHKLTKEELDFLSSLSPEERSALIAKMQYDLNAAALWRKMRLIRAAMSHLLQEEMRDAAGGLMDDIDGIQDPDE